MANITPRQMLVSPDKYSIKCPYYMTAEAITVHNTANDASANNEISYMRNNNSETSFHFAVDDFEVVQGIPLDRNAWHAGDGGNGYGNRKTIGIEICYSLSGGSRFDAAERLAAKFIAQLLKERGWGIDRVGTHQMRSGKYCPHRTLDYGWQRFLNMISAELTPPKPTITWSKLDSVKKYKTKLQPTNLWNVGTTDPSAVTSVKQFNQGEEIDIYGKFYHKEFNFTYLVTQYSYEKQLTNGFNEADMEEIKEQPIITPEPPKPEEPIVEEPIEPSSPSTPETNIEETPDSSSAGEQEGETATQTSIEEKWNNTLGKGSKSLAVIRKIANKFNIRIPMPNKLYDFLKLVALILLPLSALYVGLAPIWGWGFGNEVDQTIKLVISAIDTTLGLALVKSSSDYKKDNK